LQKRRSRLPPSNSEWVWHARWRKSGTTSFSIYDLGCSACNARWAVRRGDVIVVTCRTNRRGPDGFIRRTYEAGEIDAIAAYCAGVGQCYLLPPDMSVGTTGVQLRLAPALNNQRSGINWVRDFEFRATLSRLFGPIAQLGERDAGSVEAAGSSPAGSTDIEAA
jgi:PD-(D/E)XK endonuclease